MRSADPRPRARLVPSARHLVGALTLAVLASCADGLAPLTAAGSPRELSAAVARAGAVRLRWTPVTAQRGAVLSYIIERRTALTGPFVEIARVPAVTAGELQWFDTDVAPETIYGYRVSALTDLGDRSTPSVVAGVVTPPPPGIEVVTTSVVTASEALDPDGYALTIAGPDTVRAVLGTSGTRRFSPLRPGRYAVSLSGITDRCSTPSATQTVEVTDTLATTISPVTFTVTCRDPNRGDLTVATTITGDSLDDGWTIDVIGEAADTALPSAQRAFAEQRSQTVGAPSTTLSNLRPGTYNVTLRGLAANCTLAGGTNARTATVTRLGTATVTFAISCRGAAATPPPASNAPFVWRNRWNPRSAAPGASVTLEPTLDLTARAGQAVRGVQATLRYDPAVLRLETEEIAQLTQLIVNGSTPGTITFIASVPASSAPRTGLVGLARFRFTVIGAAGSRSPTATSGLLASSPTPFQDSVRVVEDTLTIGGGSGGAPNQPPVAQFTGPATTTVGTAVTFNGAASSDADGTIASYAWSFGDGTTGSGATPSKTYTAAGTYTVTLTVTDDRGATASRSATVTVTAATTPPPSGGAPVARANGPYTGVAGTALTLSSAGSTNATAFSWALGDGRTVTGASPSVTYAAAGTYTIVLTATGAGGATATATTTATIAPASSPSPPPTTPPPPTDTRPLTWSNQVQAFDVTNNSIAVQVVFDLTANIPETPGPEALRSFVVDSLKWDPTRLQFLSLNYGPGMVDVATTQTGASSGRLVLRGTTTPGLDAGTLVIATIRFRPIGPAGTSVTTSTFLGPLIGTSATGSFSYNARTRVIEGTIPMP